MSGNTGEIVKRLFDEAVKDFAAKKKETEITTPGLTGAARDAKLKDIEKLTNEERYKLAKIFFEGGDEKLDTGTFTREGLVKATDASGTTQDLKIVVRNGKDEKAMTYAEVLAMEEAKYAATPLSDTDKSKIAIELIGKYGAKFFDAQVEFKAKELAKAQREVTIAAAEVGKEIELAKKEDREPITDALEREVDKASDRLSTLQEKKDKYAENFREDMQQAFSDAVDARANAIDAEWIKENAHISKLAEESHPEADRLKGKYDAKRLTPTMSLEDSKKLYNKLKDVSIVSDDWDVYLDQTEKRLAAKKQYQAKVSGDSDEKLNPAGKAELAKTISKFVSDKKERYFKQFSKGFDLKKQWYEAAIAVIDAESDPVKLRKADAQERKIKEKLDLFESSIPTPFKDEIELVLNGRAGAWLDDTKFKKLQDSSAVNLDKDKYDAMREEAKKLKEYEKTEKARAEGKDTVSTGSDGKGGNGAKYAAAAVGAALLGGGLFTGKGKEVTDEKTGETKTESKWTFGRVITTVIGAITLGLAVDSLARGDKSFASKVLADRAKGGGKIMGF